MSSIESSEVLLCTRVSWSIQDALSASYLWSDFCILGWLIPAIQVSLHILSGRALWSAHHDVGFMLACLSLFLGTHFLSSVSSPSALHLSPFTLSWYSFLFELACGLDIVGYWDYQLPLI